MKVDMVLSLGLDPVLNYVKLCALACFHCPFLHLTCLQLEGRVCEAAFQRCDRIPSTTPGAEPPRVAKDSGSARSHSTHLETSSSNRP